jgi:hypothetical protein
MLALWPLLRLRLFLLWLCGRRPLCYDDAECVAAQRHPGHLTRTAFSSSLPLRWLNPFPRTRPLVCFHFPFPLPNQRLPEGSTLRSAYGGGPWDPFRYTVPVVGAVILVKFIPRTVPQVQNSTGPKNPKRPPRRRAALPYHTHSGTVPRPV